MNPPPTTTQQEPSAPITIELSGVPPRKKEESGEPFTSTDSLAERLDLLRQVIGAESVRVTVFVSRVGGVPSFRIGSIDTPEAADYAPFGEDNSIDGHTGAGHKIMKENLMARLGEEDARRFRRNYDRVAN